MLMTPYRRCGTGNLLPASPLGRIDLENMNSPNPEFVPRPDPGNNAMSGEELELARLIVSTLSLEVKPEELDPVAPLYGEGLGLDSIDMLEITLSISKGYGVKLRSDDDQSRQAFASLRSLSLYIQQHRPG